MALSQFTRLTDRQTDGQTDGQLSHCRPRLHSMQRGEKERKKESSWVKLKAFPTTVGRPNKCTN